MLKEFSDAAAEARRAYQREHYAKNKEYYRKKQEDYWARKAAKMAQNEEVVSDGTDNQ